LPSGGRSSRGGIPERVFVVKGRLGGLFWVWRWTFCAKAGALFLWSRSSFGTFALLRLGVGCHGLASEVVAAFFCIERLHLNTSLRGSAGRMGRRSDLFGPDTEYFLRPPRERQVASISLTPRLHRSQSSVAVRSTCHLRLTLAPRGSLIRVANERPMQLRSNRHSTFPSSCYCNRFR